MKSVSAVGNIPDPMKRLRAASELVRDAESALEDARALRNISAVIAHLDHDVAPVHLYRDVLDISRGMFNRHMQRAPDDATRAGIIAADPDKFGDAAKTLATAKKATKNVGKYEQIGKDAREIRDTAALLLMGGDLDAGVKPISNAEVVRATGLTSARVAQLRTGTR